jgi:hypothetical protein
MPRLKKQGPLFADVPFGTRRFMSNTQVSDVHREGSQVLIGAAFWSARPDSCDSPRHSTRDRGRCERGKLPMPEVTHAHPASKVVALKCQGTKVNGEPCGAYATTGSGGAGACVW